MAISPSTINKNRTYREDSPKALFENGGNFCSTAISFNQGDLQCFDTGTQLIRSVTATADAATFVGVAQVAVVSGVLVGPYTGLTDVTPAPSQFVGPMYGITSNMILNTGDTFTPGCKVYLVDGQNCQTVGVSDPGGGNFIGLYDGPLVTAVAGQEGPIKIGCRYPNASGGAIEF